MGYKLIVYILWYSFDTPIAQIRVIWQYIQTSLFKLKEKKFIKMEECKI